MATDLVDSTESVKRFMAMCNLTLEGNSSEQIREVQEFVHYLAEPVNVKVEDRTAKSIVQTMKPFAVSPDLQVMRRPDGSIVRGSFGKIIESKSDKSFVWKEVIAIKVIKGKPNFFMKTILQEALIQFILGDADSTLNFSVKLLDIMGSADGNTVYLKMQRADDDLFAYFGKKIQVEKGRQYLPSKVFYDVMEPLLQGLITLNKKFGFVHRDLKTDNIAFIENGPNASAASNFTISTPKSLQILLIDFGMSCAKIKVDNYVFNFQPWSTNYLATAPCSPQQDLLLLFSEIILTFGDLIAERSRLEAFITRIFDNSLQTELLKRWDTRPNGSKHLGSYNFNGSLSAGPAAYLTPEYALQLLHETYDKVSGGRRSKLRRTRRK